MKLLITGGTGLIGKQLGIALARAGHTLVGITRNKKQALLQAPFPADWIECDISKKVPDLKSQHFDGVIHLAGENVGEKNWSAEQKQKIMESRTQGTKNLIAALKNQKDYFFIGASAIGIYPASQGDDWVSEATPATQNFLAEVTQAWETVSNEVPPSVRKVLFRIGVVLSTEGGALPKMIFPAQIFASSALGSGEQWLSWIHLNDVVKAFVFAIEQQKLEGVFNLVAPEPSRQKTMAKDIAKQMNSFYGPPVPGFMLKLILGEQASLALNSMRVSSKKLVDAGFSFQFKTVETALEDLLGGWKNGIAIRHFQQYFPLPRERVFQFFASADNLERITPESLHFRILKMSTPAIEAGTLIDYKLKIHQVPVRWRTRIETWKTNEQFTDTQQRGPYTLWHHTHNFEDLAGGTLMTDIVRYKLPLGLLGRLFAQAWVDKDVETIFQYRRNVVEKYL